MVVLALPRGGVPVGYEVARALGAPLDVMVVRKLGAPGQPELGIGAIAPDGTRVVDERAVETLGVTESYLERVEERERAEMARRLREFRGGLPAPEFAGRTVILVDDGLATGVTAMAAVRAVRKQSPAKLVLAVPVCSSEASARLAREVDEYICLSEPPDFVAVGMWYEQFEQTSDREVRELLRRAREQAEVGRAGSGSAEWESE